ncbi:putative RNase H [Lyophyllum shimeji]|uniref:RNase H n=1 Tax=Lyophyllum shimeji TaxID=47721 RepID=A0A9P3UNE3_LYOSH|nr:putative RNase H [Lyophyllum shimeji]
MHAATAFWRKPLTDMDTAITFQRMAKEVCRAQSIVSHRLFFCHNLDTNFVTAELAAHCEYCSRFFVFCCQHRDWIEKICHHYRIAFTDGACLSNRKDSATAGIGVAIGKLGLNYDQWSIPVDDDMDLADPTRTNQRAELLAASIETLERLRLAESETEEPRRKHSKEQKTGPEWVIATDSEYIVKVIPERSPVWRAGG